MTITREAPPNHLGDLQTKTVTCPKAYPRRLRTNSSTLCTLKIYTESQPLDTRLFGVEDLVLDPLYQMN